MPYPKKIIRTIINTVQPVAEYWFERCDAVGIEARVVPPLPEEVEYGDGLAEFCNLLPSTKTNAPWLVRVCLMELEPTTQLLAVAALRVLAGEIVDHVRKLLTYRESCRSSLNASIRWCAAITLGLLGPEARKQCRRAVPALLRRLAKERDGDVRAAIVWALGEITPASRKVQTALLNTMLFDESPKCRGFAETALNGYDYCVADFRWYAPSADIGSPGGPADSLGERWQELIKASAN